MYPDASLAMKSTAFATSSGVPSRPNEVRDATVFRTSGGVKVSWNVVSIIPGEMQFTRIFFGASSFDNPRVSVRTAPFAAE
jgi:hypothetical protein